VRRRLAEGGPRVFPLAIGGNALGSTTTDEAAFAVLDAYVAGGGDLVATSAEFAGGRSEAIIGDWMRSRGIRDRLTVATRIGGAPRDLSSAAVMSAVTASLGRLRTDRVDLLLLEGEDEKVPFEETLVAVDENVRAGRVLQVGLSGCSANRLVEARVFAAQLGLTPVSVVETRYSLTHREEYEGALTRVAGQQGLGFLPRFPLDGGFLAGNYRRRTELELNTTGNIVLGGDAAKHFNRRGQRILAALDAVAREHEVEPATIAIAWLLLKPNVVAPVTGASNPGQVAALLAASEVRLTRQQLALLDEASD
jgi:aryl-alcohol dehydrogenase-like predicted oxidoreductase